MLTEGDIDFMHEAQDEIYTLRQRPVIVIHLEKIIDDFTGEVISENEEPREVNAVVTEFSIRSKDGTRRMEGGIEYEQGDVKIDIKREYIEDVADKIVRAEYDDKKYELLGDDKKGIGRRNRYEFIGRVIA